MGNKFEVWTWERIEGAEFGAHNAYQYVQFWRGQSLLKALWNLYKAKKTGSGCVKLEWR